MAVDDEPWKLPEPPDIESWNPPDPDIVYLPAGERVARLVFMGGEYPCGWNQFRHFGPTSSRFDHHAMDESGQPYLQDFGIMYLAYGPAGFNTCLAECFQTNRKINLTANEPVMATFRLAREVPLLDLRGAFSTRMGASQAIHSGQRSIARRWSRLLYHHYPEAVGLLYRSSMNGGEDAIALFERGAPAIPERASSHRMLNDPLLAASLASASNSLGYELTRGV